MIALEYLIAGILFGALLIPVYHRVRSQYMRDTQLAKAKAEKVDADKSLEVEKIKQEADKVRREAEELRERRVREAMKGSE